MLDALHFWRRFDRNFGQNFIGKVTGREEVDQSGTLSVGQVQVNEARTLTGFERLNEMWLQLGQIKSKFFDCDWWPHINSVTRWLDYFSIFGHLQKWKLAQLCHKFAKVGSAFYQMGNEQSKILPDLKSFAQLAKFCQIWSHRLNMARSMSVFAPKFSWLSLMLHLKKSYGFVLFFEAFINPNHNICGF